MLPLAYFGIESSGLNLVIDLLILFAVVLYLSLIYWTYADATRRIVDPMLIGCATAASLFPFVGTIIYLILRPPEYLEDVRERELEIQAAEARLYELDTSRCPHCDYRVERDFVRCPSCLRKLKERCLSCGRPLDQAWTICPYCETEVPPSVSRRSRRRRAPQVHSEHPELGTPATEGGRLVDEARAERKQRNPAGSASSSGADGEGSRAALPASEGAGAPARAARPGRPGPRARPGS